MTFATVEKRCPTARHVVEHRSASAAYKIVIGEATSSHSDAKSAPSARKCGYGGSWVSELQEALAAEVQSAELLTYTLD